MSHAFTLALVYALVLHAACLLHAAMAGWTATRLVAVEPLTLIGAPVVAALGMALMIDAVTVGMTTIPWLRAIGWLGGVLCLFITVLAHEGTRSAGSGAPWRPTRPG
jgi:hypothetical protein